MSLFFTITAACMIAIIAAEMMMWRLFRIRIAGLLFPRDIDASLLQFFTLPRLRFAALFHTLFLLVAVVVLFWLTW